MAAHGAIQQAKHHILQTCIFRDGRRQKMQTYTKEASATLQVSYTFVCNEYFCDTNFCKQYDICGQQIEENYGHILEGGSDMQRQDSTE